MQLKGKLIVKGPLRLGPKQRQGNHNMKTRQKSITLADYMYPILRRKKKRIKDPKELLDRALAHDDPEQVHDMYDEDAYRFDMARKEYAERWDR